MVNLTATLQAALFLAQLLTVIHGMEEGGRDMRGVNNNFGGGSWSQDGHSRGNEISGEEAIADLLKVSPWTLYANQGKLTFARESRNSASFQPRSGRDEESQFTETSRSPPFAPRLGRVLHYSPRFRRITLN
ncbi:hypothetical protein GE061_000854 [Apolygus lucorum]|uniref:Uncharacterized protein n=1 Tax=Apolygus lucorum TaxID=248454 RepID=A0A8S9Y5F5_APOLU|nr:hypothetical protein GE061_000854 [Apolygus lucorum]